jgi:hypothetical protein
MKGLEDLETEKLMCGRLSAVFCLKTFKTVDSIVHYVKYSKFISYGVWLEAFQKTS